MQHVAINNQSIKCRSNQCPTCDTQSHLVERRLEHFFLFSHRLCTDVLWHCRILCKFKVLPKHSNRLIHTFLADSASLHRLLNYRSVAIRFHIPESLFFLFLLAASPSFVASPKKRHSPRRRDGTTRRENLIDFPPVHLWRKTTRFNCRALPPMRGRRARRAFKWFAPKQLRDERKVQNILPYGKLARGFSFTIFSSFFHFWCALAVAGSSGIFYH